MLVNTLLPQYSGDNKYNSAKTTASFNVNKHESKVDISADDIEIGKTAVVTINVTPGAIGNVTVCCQWQITGCRT